MAFKNFPYLIILSSLLSLSLSISLSSHPNTTITTTPPPSPPQENLGKWALLQKTIGISAMHMQLLYNNKLVIFDRTDFGLSNLSLPAGKCRYNDDVIKVDCTAHSILYDVGTNVFRPLMVQTDFWCSSGAVMHDGTLLQTGGYLAGAQKIREFSPCEDEQCDWIELEQNLKIQRWYASNQILPDGRVIIVGGRRAFSYEFFPKNQEIIGSLRNVFNLSFLIQTSDPKEENNLYPFLHVLPDGNLFIFANTRSILFDYTNHRVLKEYPVIPDAKRSYPSTGSSVLLPLNLISGEVLPEAEVMICGGSYGGAYLKARIGDYVAASNSCGRLKVSDPDPKWVMEEMPMGRVMSDMLLLPTGDVIIINGAGRGTAGWERADNPVLYPVLYSTNMDDPGKRFTLLNPTNVPRMYHSAATLLPDGRILVGGSNPHVYYNFTDVKYPTDLSLEAFSPPYLASNLSDLQPSIISVEGPSDYGQQFYVIFELGSKSSTNGMINVVMIAPSFTTHSFAMNQRMLVLDSSDVQKMTDSAYKATVFAPPSRNVAPPGYYMLFVVNEGVPSHCVWIQMKL